jgi:hypothetical protein
MVVFFFCMMIFIIFVFLVHQEHLSETDKLLRAFDLNYAFGPCVGIKRIDRWGNYLL